MNAPTTSTQGGEGKAPARAASVHPLRAISFNDPAVSIERRADGTLYLRPNKPLAGYPRRVTDRLYHFVEATPDRVFMAMPSCWRRAGTSPRRCSSAGCRPSAR
jgi:feruloyl-CoA synthase